VLGFIDYCKLYASRMRIPLRGRLIMGYVTGAEQPWISGDRSLSTIAMFSRLVLVANAFLVYLLTLSYPGLLDLSNIASDIVADFRKSSLAEWVFGIGGVALAVTLFRQRAYRALDSSAACGILSICAVILILTNYIGFRTPISTYVIVNDVTLKSSSGMVSARTIKADANEENTAGASKSGSFRQTITSYLDRQRRRHSVSDHPFAWSFWEVPEPAVALIGTLRSPDSIQLVRDGKGPNYDSSQTYIQRIRTRVLRIFVDLNLEQVNDLDFRLDLDIWSSHYFDVEPSSKDNFTLPIHGIDGTLFKFISETIYHSGNRRTERTVPLLLSDNLDWLERLSFGDTAGTYENFNKVADAYADKVKKDPNDPTTRYILATAYMYTGKWSDADAQLTAAQRLDPDAGPLIEFQRGVSLYFQGRFSEARDIYQKLYEAAKSLAPSVWVAANRDWIIDRLALTTWRAAYKLAQTRPFSPYNRSNKRFSGEIDKASVLFNEAEAAFPATRKARLLPFHIAQFHTYLGEYNEAAERYQYAAGNVSGPVLSEVRHRAAESLRLRGSESWRDARELYRQAAILFEQSCESKDAQCYFTRLPLGPEEIGLSASYYYTNALPAFKFHLMQVYLADGPADKAKAALDSAERLNRVLLAYEAARREGKDGVRFVPEVLIELYDVVGELLVFAARRDEGIERLQQSINIELGVSEGSQRPAHILIPDARLHLAEALISPSAVGETGVVPQHDLGLAKDLLIDAQKLAIYNSYLVERVQSAMAKISALEAKAR
jgi:tetratricopeptide (TPR) repeat protein